MNGLSGFLWVWIALVAVLGWTVSTRDEYERGRFFAAFAGVVLAASTRDLLWIFVGFEVLSVATLRLGARTIAGTIASLGGLVLLVIPGGATDLAAVEPTTAVKLGLVLFVGGIVSRWLQSSGTDRFVFLGAGVAIVAVFIRIAAWSPGLAEALEPMTWLAAMAGIFVGGWGAALSATTRSFVVWLTIALVALAIAAVAGGAPVLPHVLMHVAASTVALALLLSGGSVLALWLTLLSLASFPPLPGFTTKLGLLMSFSPVTLTLALVSLLLIGVGCARALGRREPSEPARLWASVAAVVMSVAFGLFPGPMFGAATRAATALF